ncbi:MAG TPA: glycosyltransferase [Gemmatimonadaceae bacterium]|nr:glycosyltransferase [Gemmatimonadaceae bacterium]
MRVLILGSSNPWRMEAAIARAFERAGHVTMMLDDRRIKRAIGHALTQRWVLLQAKRFRADFILLSKCMALDIETVAALVRDTPNAMWYHDAAYFNDSSRPDIAHIVNVGRLSDRFFVTGFEAEWRALGLNAKFLPAAADRSIVPVAPDPRYAADISFTGTGYDESRAQLLIALSRRFRVRVWGTSWERWRDTLDWGGRAVEGREFTTVCSSSTLMLGIHPKQMHSADQATSDRLWMTILAGGMYLGPYANGVAGMLQDGVHCAWYTDVDSCIAQAERYLGDPELVARVRAQGEAFVRAHHTYDERIRHLLPQDVAGRRQTLHSNSENRAFSFPH